MDLIPVWFCSVSSAYVTSTSFLEITWKVNAVPCTWWSEAQCSYICWAEILDIKFTLLLIVAFFPFLSFCSYFHDNFLPLSHGLAFCLVAELLFKLTLLILFWFFLSELKKTCSLFGVSLTSWAYCKVSAYLLIWPSLILL